MSALNTEFHQHVTHYFASNHNVELDQMIQALDAATPCGPDLRSNGLYLEITDARRADDPSLPRGDWTHELKKADWSKVSRLATDALRHKSKDLQVSAWLLEAEIWQRGFVGIAPTFVLINQLIHDFWQDINPPIEDIERRYNIFQWIDEKLARVVNQVPLIVSLNGDQSFAGMDIDRALEIERAIEGRKIEPAQVESVRWPEMCKVAERMPDDIFVNHYHAINWALFCLDELSETLAQHFGERDAPSLSTFKEQLDKAMEFQCMELDRRGILNQLLNPEPAVSETQEAQSSPEEQGAQQGVSETATAHHIDSVIQDRQQAYQQLNQIAGFLAKLEPHSPVPYLIKRAVEWGHCDTAELYREIFVVNKGQLDLFELLGINDAEQG